MKPVRRHDEVVEAAGQHQRVQQQEAVRPEASRSAAPSARRQQPAEHVAAVERRNRNHVEHGQQHVELHARGSSSVGDRHRHVRLAERHAATPAAAASSDRRDEREHQIARRAGRRDQHVVAPRVPQVPHVRPAPASPSRCSGTPADHRDAAETAPCRSRSACTSGLSDTRPSSRAVGSPSRSAVHACAISCTVSENSRTMNAMKICAKSMSSKECNRLRPTREKRKNGVGRFRADDGRQFLARGAPHAGHAAERRQQRLAAAAARCPARRRAPTADRASSARGGGTSPRSDAPRRGSAG